MTTTHNVFGETLSRALGLSAGITPEQARNKLQAIGQYEPETAERIADKLMETTLQLIADGYPGAPEIASWTLIVASAKFPRGYVA